NFSFGDYFKKDAIQFAFEVATKVFGFEKERIWPTVYKDDDEAFELWKAYVPEERITRFGEKENFWAMGDTGPCGPCSELLYDRGEKYGTAKNPSEDPDGERFLEFWNLVFMQYNRNNEGVLEPLPRPSIDTGAGLERIAALKANVDNVFETDILRGLIAEIEKISGIAYNPKDSEKAPAFNVIADHMRCLSFAIADGVSPSNVDRGYVLRKILRRAIRYGRMLQLNEPFLARLLPKLIELMGDDYPELKKSKNRIAEILTQEEEAFIKTLQRGGNMLNQIIESATAKGHKISGDDAFKLKDTYGFPLEEIMLIAKDSNLEVDLARFLELEKEAKERSKNSSKTVQQMASQNLFANFAAAHGETTFLGFKENQTKAKVLAIVSEDAFVNELTANMPALIILDKTPFYAEMGGQVGDTGTLTNKTTTFEVTDSKAPYKGIIAHAGELKSGQIQVGDELLASIDYERREKIENNHTATHLLHWALHKVLGEHIKQAGSVVDESRLRFDFSHHKALTEQEMEQIEDLVNSKIRENKNVDWYEISFDEAQKQSEIKQFFGEKYGSKVRVVDIGYSKELCGGTHTGSVGNIGYFRIAKESSIAAGVRRIEALTGKLAEEFARSSDHTLKAVAASLKTVPTKLQERIEKLSEENKQLSLELKALKKEQLEKTVHTLIHEAEKLNDSALILKTVPLPADDLRQIGDLIMEKLKSAILVLSTLQKEQCHFIIRVSNDLVAKGNNAAEFVKKIAPLIEGGGGGRQNQAQASGKAVQQLKSAENTIRELIKI
ncbi:MAG TPA: alanine--tRNA ligase, partial [Parachlamydiaceae bacterium]|nr:alanine--tRNA ligase [Parachlamydiaceae bacterium]